MIIIYSGKLMKGKYYYNMQYVNEKYYKDLVGQSSLILLC